MSETPPHKVRQSLGEGWVEVQEGSPADAPALPGVGGAVSATSGAASDRDPSGSDIAAAGLNAMASFPSALSAFASNPAEHLEKLQPLAAKMSAAVRPYLPQIHSAYAGLIDAKEYIVRFHLEDCYALLLGLALLFCGGYFMLTITVVEAFRQTGWNIVLNSFTSFRATYRAARQAMDEADNTAVEAVERRSAATSTPTAGGKKGDAAAAAAAAEEAVLRRRFVALLQTVDPDQVSAAIGGLYVGGLAAYAALRIEVARLITLGACVGEKAYEFGRPLLLPLVLKKFGLATAAENAAAGGWAGVAGGAGEGASGALGARGGAGGAAGAVSSRGGGGSLSPPRDTRGRGGITLAFLNAFEEFGRGGKKGGAEDGSAVGKKGGGAAALQAALVGEGATQAAGAAPLSGAAGGAAAAEGAGVGDVMNKWATSGVTGDGAGGLLARSVGLSGGSGGYGLGTIMGGGMSAASTFVRGGAVGGGGGVDVVRWVDRLLLFATRVAVVIVALWFRRLVFAAHSAVRGGKVVTDVVVHLALKHTTDAQQRDIARSVHAAAVRFGLSVPGKGDGVDDEQAQLDALRDAAATLGLALAVGGFYTQLCCGFGLPFLLQLLLLPFVLLESVLSFVATGVFFTSV